MPDAGQLGIILSGVAAIIMSLSGLLVSFSKKRDRDSVELREIRPKYLDSLQYIFDLQVWAARNGQLSRIPTPPKSLLPNENTNNNSQHDYGTVLEQIQRMGKQADQNASTDRPK